MPANPAFSGPQVLVFDTGPLWELVLYSAVHELRFERLKGELRHLQNNSYYERLGAFIASFPSKTTTPHVVAEISSWITRTEPKGQSAIWGLTFREFWSMRMDESIVKLLEMPQELVADIGAVDTSVLKLASSFGEKKSVVLSVDGSLVAECRRAGVDAKDLWEVIA